MVDTEWKWDAVEPKCERGQTSFAQTIEDLDDACRFPRTSPAGDSAVTRSPDPSATGAFLQPLSRRASAE